MLIGPEKSKKSFTALDMAAAIQSGQPWLGDGEKKVTRGQVVYVIGEGNMSDWKARWKACRRGYSCAGEDALDRLNEIRFLFDRPFLDQEGVSEDLIKAMRYLDRAPVLVVLDTMAPTFSGEENSAKEVGAYVQAVDTIREDFGCAVLVLHHVPIDGKRPRGSSALAGAVDTIMRMDSHGQGEAPAVLKCESTRSGMPFEDVPLEYVVEKLGTDKWGNNVTSLRVCLGDPDILRSSQTSRNEAKDKILSALREWPDQVGPCSKELQEASGVRGGSFTRTTTQLLQSGKIRCTRQGNKKLWSEATADTKKV